MARYGVSHYGSSFYGAPLTSVFSAEPFTAVATGYGEITLSWTSPGGTWDDLVLVRNLVGYPVTETNGVVVYTAASGADVHHFVDPDLPTDHWVYYTILVHDPSQDLWIRSGSTRAYSPRSYNGGKHMYDLVPRVGQSDALLKFMQVLGFCYDGLRNDANSLLDLYNADTVLYDLVPVLMQQFGIPAETELEPEQYRRFLRNAVHFYKTKGTSECAHGVTVAVTGWPCYVTLGANLLWDAAHSDFVGGLGYWGRKTENCTVAWVPAGVDSFSNPVPAAMRMTATANSQISAAFLDGSVKDDLHRLGISVVHNSAYSIGMSITGSDLALSPAHIDIDWYDLTGNYLSTSVGVGVATRSGVPVVVDSLNEIAPTNAVWAVPKVVVDSATSGSHWDVRTVMFNRGSQVLPHQPGHDIRIYLDITDTDPLRIAVHKERLNAILPRYLPFGATFTLIDGMPTAEVVVNDDTILVDYDPPPPTAPVGRSLTVRYNVDVDNTDLLSVRWAVRQTVGASVAVRYNVIAHVGRNLTVEYNAWSNHYTATYTTPYGGP